MKKLISFSMFAMIVLFALVGRNTANAQSSTQQDVVGTPSVGQGCHGSRRTRLHIGRTRGVNRPFRAHPVRMHRAHGRLRRYGW